MRGRAAPDDAATDRRCVRHRALARVLAPLAVAVVLASCGSSPTPSTAATPASATEHATVSAGPVLTVPADFPIDVHLPAAAYTILNVARTPTSVVLTVHSSQPRDRLYAEYDAAMKAAGWKQAMAVQPSPAESVMTFRKGTRVLTVSLATRAGGSDAGTDVALQLNRELPGH
jgi:hypothetical protein